MTDPSSRDAPHLHPQPQPVGALPLPAGEGRSAQGSADRDSARQDPTEAAASGEDPARRPRSGRRPTTFIVQGGPFDAFPGDGFGLCLEARSRRAGEATVVLDVPDFGVPAPAALDAALARLVDALYAGRAAYIGCKAGQGRTGLALACLARAFGVGQPVAYVRRHYSPRAVETAEQERFVATAALPLTDARLRAHRRPTA